MEAKHTKRVSRGKSIKPKSVAIIGCTGPLGLCLKDAVYTLAAGHYISLFVPDREKEREYVSYLLPENLNLTLTVGDLRSQETINKILSSHNFDAIIISAVLPDDSCSEATKCVLNWLEANPNPYMRLVIVSSIGCGDSKNELSYYDRMIRYMFPKVFQDLEYREQIVINSLHENWIIIRAGELNNDPATSVYRVEDKIPKGGKISRDDLARWIVKNLGSHGDKWIGKTPSICY